MKLITGLGNPDAKYMKTRHNTGFMVLDSLFSKKGIRLMEKFKSFFAKDEDILYCLPKTYMNLSGLAVSEIANFYKIAPEDILIIYDDIALPLGTLRFREDGSDGGHNGIKSIIKELGSNKFKRLKVGIGPQPSGVPSERFVLDNFKPDEEIKLKKIIEIARDAVLEFPNTDFQKLQGNYNKNHV